VDATIIIVQGEGGDGQKKCKQQTDRQLCVDDGGALLRLEGTHAGARREAGASKRSPF